MTTAAWAEHEVATADLGDRRRRRRLARLLTDLAERPTASIPGACADAAATKAAYRFLDEAAIEPDAIVDAHVAATADRLRGHRRILALQDTTELDYTGHPALVGAGPLAHPAHAGLLVHSVLATTPDGVPLGLLHQHRWARDPAAVGQRHARRRRPTSAKESQRWLDAQAATRQAVPADVHVVTVADREADIFDLFALDRPPRTDLLIRATHNRAIVEEAKYLWAAVRATPVAEVVPVPVGRRADRWPREAELTIRWVALTLRPPRHHKQRATLQPQPVVAILAEEPRPPAGEKPIRWLLVTTLRVQGGEEALTCVRWYARRWLIERYHFVLKQGCRVEGLQLRATDRLERALAVYAIVAWRVLWLTYLARAEPDLPCTAALTAVEWQVLFVTTQHTAELPPQPPTIRDAVRWLAQLGGFLGRAGDGDPGPKTVWQGLCRLEDLVRGWRLAHQFSPSVAPLQLVGNG